MTRPPARCASPWSARLALTLLSTGAGLLACRSAGGSEFDREAGGSSDRAIEAVTRLEAPRDPMLWLPDPDHRVRSRVLIVAADEGPDVLALREARDSATRLRSAFLQAGLTPEDVRVVSGGDVTNAVTKDSRDSRLERIIREHAAGIREDGGELFVIWIGHGKQLDGTLKLATADSRVEDGRMLGLMDEAELIGWLKDLRSERDGLEIGLAIDACRTGEQAYEAPALGDLNELWRRTREQSLDLLAYSAPQGIAAYVDRDHSVTRFSLALAERIEDRTRHGLRAPLEMRELLEQLPSHETFTGLGGPPAPLGSGTLQLLDPSDLSLRVEVVDTLSEQPVPGAVVELQGRLVESAPAEFEGLSVSKGGYHLNVDAPGYINATLLASIDRENMRKKLVVKLEPTFVLLEGQVEIQGRGVVEIALSGGLPGLIEKHHVVQARMSESGPFLLRLPELKGERQLIFRLNGQVVAETPIDLARMSPRIEPYGAGTLRCYSLENVVLTSEGGGLRLSDLADRAGVGLVEFPTNGPGPDAFPRSRDADLWKQALALIEQGRYEYALRKLEGLFDSGRLDSETESAVRDLRWIVVAARDLERARQVKDGGRLAEALTRLADSEARQHPAIIECRVAWLGRYAAESYEAKQFEPAIDCLRQLGGLDPDRRTQIDPLAISFCREWTERATHDGIETGEWEEARRALARLEELGGREAAASLRDEIERESISRACRDAYNKATDAVGGGRMEEAEGWLRLALEQDPNAFYDRKLEELVELVEQKLSTKYLGIGNEHEGGERPVEALEAYLRVSRYDPVQARIEIEFLLEKFSPVLEAQSVNLLESAHEFLALRERIGRVRLAAQNGDYDRARDAYRALEASGQVDSGELSALRDRIDLEMRRKAELALANFEVYRTLVRTEVEDLVPLFEQIYPRLTEGLVHLRVSEFAGRSSRRSGSRKLPSIATYRDTATGAEFCLIPGGTFVPGAMEGNSASLTFAPFLMAREEVSARQYWSGAEAELRKLESSERILPMIGLRWADARDWCESRGMRLPTEAQWEWCALAGSPTSFEVENKVRRLEASGAGWTNDFGLHYMIGNASEWCLDAWGPQGTPAVDSTGLRRGESRETAPHPLRGGCWQEASFWVHQREKVSARGNDCTGFRPVILLEAPRS